MVVVQLWLQMMAILFANPAAVLAYTVAAALAAYSARGSLVVFATFLGLGVVLTPLVSLLLIWVTRPWRRSVAK